MDAVAPVPVAAEVVTAVAPAPAAEAVVVAAAPDHEMSCNAASDAGQMDTESDFDSGFLASSEGGFVEIGVAFVVRPD